MGRRFQTLKKIDSPTHFLPHPKIVPVPKNPKMSKNGCSASMVMSDMVGKPMGKRFQNDKKF